METINESELALLKRMKSFFLNVQKKKVFFFLVLIFSLTFVLPEFLYSASKPPFSKAELSDREWADRAFQNLIWPLGDKEVLIASKQLRLTEDQRIKIQELIKAHELQNRYWKEVWADTSGQYSSDPEMAKKNRERAEESKTACLEMAISLRKSLGAKSGLLLEWINKELELKRNIFEVRNENKELSAEEVSSRIYQRAMAGHTFSQDDRWWIEKRILFLSYGNGRPSLNKQNRKELIKKRDFIFKEMMSK